MCYLNKLQNARCNDKDVWIRDLTAEYQYISGPLDRLKNDISTSANFLGGCQGVPEHGIACFLKLPF